MGSGRPRQFHPTDYLMVTLSLGLIFFNGTCFEMSARNSIVSFLGVIEKVNLVAGGCHQVLVYLLVCSCGILRLRVLDRHRADVYDAVGFLILDRDICGLLDLDSHELRQVGKAVGESGFRILFFKFE